MAKRRTSKELTDLRKRLSSSKLTKSDVTTIDEILSTYVDAFKAMEASKEKIGGKTVVARLPFGFDIVK